MLNLENGHLTIELSPFQCASLAKACHLAGTQSCEAELEIWRTLAALFQACTIAGYAQWHMTDLELEALRAQLAILNLRNDDSQHDHGRLNGHMPG